MGSFDEAWQVICDYFQNEKKITEVAYKTWISRIEPKNIDFEKGEITLLVPNDFHRQTLMRCYIPMLEDAYKAVFGTTFETNFVIPDEDNKKEQAKFLSNEQSADAGYEFTFDTFIVGQSNKFAHAACLAVAQNPAGAYNPLFLYGNSGLGKTHLLYAIGNDIKNNHPDKKIIYIKGDDFTNELIESIRLATTSEFRQKYRQADVLLVDDVQFIGGKERTQEEFFHTFNALYDSNKQIIISSDRMPKEIETLEDRMRNRFEWGLIADIQAPDLETRMAILRQKAANDQIELPNDVLTLLATSITSSRFSSGGPHRTIKKRMSS